MKVSEKFIKNIEKSIETEIENKFTNFLVEDDEALNKYIEKEKKSYLKEKKEKIKEVFPFDEDVNNYENFLNLEKKKVSEKEIDVLEDISLRTGQPFQRKWWEKKISNKEITELVEKEWGRNLDFLVDEWEEEQINLVREEITQKYEHKIKKIKELRNMISFLDFESGVLWDLTETDIINSDMKTLMKWVSFFNNNKDIQKLCDLLGKMRVYNQNLKKQNHSSADENIAIPKINSKEEISRVKLGNTIEAVLPNELSLLNSEDMQILFDLKFVENKLMMYDFQGSQDIKKEETKEINQSEEVEEKGPVIICLDTSGSMSGSRERVAKAICFSLISRAISQKRLCMLINFSVKIETMQFNKISTFSEIFDFLTKSFYGGTDALPALTYSLDLLEKEEYNRADILMVSDFLLEEVDEKVEERINKAKELDNKFYSIAIGNLNMEEKLKDLFEKQWSYNPATASLELLNEIAFEYENAK
ncbi:MAG: VWA domain-containing protein [Fusobacterium sp.]|nr:VWA domain-containing protein [Fusobacterium sp.]